MTDILAEGCKRIHSDYLAPGWACCKCRCYNGLQRDVCRNCGHAFCGPADQASTSIKQPAPAPADLPYVPPTIPAEPYQCTNLPGQDLFVRGAARWACGESFNDYGCHRPCGCGCPHRAAKDDLIVPERPAGTHPAPVKKSLAP